MFHKIGSRCLYYKTLQIYNVYIPSKLVFVNPPKVTDSREKQTLAFYEIYPFSEHYRSVMIYVKYKPQEPML